MRLSYFDILEFMIFKKYSKSLDYILFKLLDESLKFDIIRSLINRTFEFDDRQEIKFSNRYGFDHYVKKGSGNDQILERIYFKDNTRPSLKTLILLKNVLDDYYLSEKRENYINTMKNDEANIDKFNKVSQIEPFNSLNTLYDE